MSTDLKLESITVEVFVATVALQHAISHDLINFFENGLHILTHHVKRISEIFVFLIMFFLCF